ncbi:MAG: efflux RND transporter periplasmic adaptor subunit [Bacteroidota bacterium]|nr:efflux RND transporter periplasmic adaptor subunit [Bacteroidota bacterium]
MLKYFTRLFFLFFSSVIIFCSCKSKDASGSEAPAAEPRTPVTVTSINYDPLEESVNLNATSTYLQKNFVKSNLIGYVQKSNIRFGDYVNRGQTLFILKTKEATAIGNSVNKLNPDFKFSGVNVIRADASGYVTEVNHQAGDYVQDGEQLAVINDSKSFVFVMNVPYEYKQYVSVGKQVQLTLPDGERLLATVKSSLPMVDSVSQTQAVSLIVNSSRSIPVNLLAKVKIIKVTKTAAPTLEKKAVLSDETLSNFWVMKMIDDSTAVKVPVKTGIETGDKVEIISPEFSSKDRILLNGNYGLADTAKVTVSPSPSKGSE